MNEKLLANARFYFAQSVFMNSCHFHAMDRLKKKENKLSLFIKISSAIMIISLILQILGVENNIQQIIRMATYLGLLVTAISLIFQILALSKTYPAACPYCRSILSKNNKW